MDEAPILLQHRCRVEYRLRSTIAMDGDHLGHNDDRPQRLRGDGFEATVARARLALDAGGAGSRAWIDLVCCYETEALNEEAKVHASGLRADAGEKRLATWEIFPTDVVLCSANQRQLDPRLYGLTAAVVEKAAAA